MFASLVSERRAAERIDANDGRRVVQRRCEEIAAQRPNVDVGGDEERGIEVGGRREEAGDEEATALADHDGVTRRHALEEDDDCALPQRVTQDVLECRRVCPRAQLAHDQHDTAVPQPAPRQRRQWQEERVDVVPRGGLAREDGEPATGRQSLQRQHDDVRCDVRPVEGVGGPSPSPRRACRCRGPSG